jgi:hypothetical protein
VFFARSKVASADDNCFSFRALYSLSVGASAHMFNMKSRLYPTFDRDYGGYSLPAKHFSEICAHMQIALLSPSPEAFFCEAHVFQSLKAGGRQFEVSAPKLFKGE